MNASPVSEQLAGLVAFMSQVQFRCMRDVCFRANSGLSFMSSERRTCAVSRPR
jgi:hypothetical protein